MVLSIIIKIAGQARDEVIEQSANIAFLLVVEKKTPNETLDLKRKNITVLNRFILPILHFQNHRA